MKRIHLLRWAGADGRQEGPAALEPLFAAARAEGLRVGWLDLAGAASAPAAPGDLEATAAAGAFRAVAAGGGRVVSVKATVGPAVLADLLREHFLGCALVVIRASEQLGGGLEPAGVPSLEATGSLWRVTAAGRATRELTSAELVARLRRPRPWD